jgi:hypothetical protein
MRAARSVLWSALAVVALLAATAVPGHAQARGKSHHKHYAVSADKAVHVTRTVLVRHGFEVVRVQRSGPTHVVYYKPGKGWRGKGRRPIHRLVIRTVQERVVFEETDPSVLLDIDVKLKL